jgi:hypothetical protein
MIWSVPKDNPIVDFVFTTNIVISPPNIAIAPQQLVYLMVTMAIQMREGGRTARRKGFLRTIF